MTKKILNLHRMHTNNVGDLRCAPYLYFADLLGSEAREILGFRQADEPDRDRRLAFAADFAAADIMVIGGGGLLEIDFFTPFYKYLAENRQPHQKTVIWGAGHNSWVLGDWRNLKQRYSFDPSQFDLIGIRDADEIYPWVPCVSCMSPAFDVPRAAKREVGVYAHVGTINNESFRKKLPSEFDILDNSASFEDAVDFLSSSELVLTDSFHGAYWATLMGRKVVGFPSSSKFYSMKHAIPLCAPEDWKRFSKLAQVYDGALEECRDANTQYAQQVAQLIYA